MKKRALIYFFFDKDGIVDRYVVYALKKLREMCEYILVVCNGSLTVEGREILEHASDDVFCRKNTGLDITAYKEAIEFIGWEKLYKFDELVMVNFTMFGPFYPLSEMFDEMDTRDVDYWGLSKVFEDKTRTTLFGRDVLPYDYIHDYTPSNFRVIRSSLLHAIEFRKYWETLPKVNDYIDSALYGEIYFNKIFSDAGYTFDTYMSDDTRGTCPSPNENEILHLIIKERLPFMRRKSWLNPYDSLLVFGYGNEPSDSLEYLKNNTDYDVSMIFENLLRTVDHTTLKDRLQLNLIMPENYSFNEKKSKSKVAVIAHIYYDDCVEMLYNYFLNFPKETDFYLTTSNKEVKEHIDELCTDINCTVTVIENRGRDVSALLIPYKNIVLSGDYDYVCYTHDKKEVHIDRKMGENFALRCYRSMFGTKTVVENIIATLDAHPEIGMLSPQPVYHGRLFPNIGGNWTNNFANVKKLAEKLELKVPIKADAPPVASYGSVFWFRPNAMKKMYEYNWKYSDFPEEPLKVLDGTMMHAIERIHPIVAQDSGYFPAYALTDAQAKSEITSLTYILKKITNIIFSKKGDRADFQGTLNFLSSLSAAPKTSETPVKTTLTGKKRVFITALSPDYGKGFLKEDELFGKEINPNFSYKQNFDLQEATSQINFAPVKDFPCIVKNAYAECDEKSCVLSPTNGVRINKINYFVGTEPCMTIDTKGSRVEKVTVNAEIVPLTQKVYISIFTRYIKEYIELKKIEEGFVDEKFTAVQVHNLKEYDYESIQSFSVNENKQVLYVDYGKGYNDKDTVVSDCAAISDCGLFEMEYSFSSSPNKLRFDPANKSGCIVSAMEIISDAGMLEYKCLNGFELYGNYVFFTLDSQFEIVIPAGVKINKLSLRAFIEPIGNSILYEALNDCKVNSERLKRLKELMK